MPPWILALTIAVLLGAMYSHILHGGFLWDDSAHVTPPSLRSLEGLGRIWFEVGATQQYYPLLHSAFWVQAMLWADHTTGYHVVNLVLHGMTAFLFGVTLHRLGVRGAAWAALIFAVHPVHVESAAWISEQKNTLSAVLYLSAALMYLRYDRSRRLAAYLGATALFLLALLTKSVTASLPAALLVAFWWQRGHIRWRSDVAPLLPWFVLAAAAGLHTAWFERTLIGATGEEFDLSWLQRLLLAGQVVWFYLGRLAWPSELTFIYPRWTISPERLTQWLPLIAATATTAGLWILRHRTRAPFAGLLLFGGTLFPVLGFLNVYPFRFSFVADHFQYIASFGIIALAAAAIDQLARTRGQLAGAGAAAALAALAVVSWVQAAPYRDAESLWRVTIARNPECWMAHNNLGLLLDQRGAADAAIDHFQTAIRVNPWFADAHNNLGVLLARKPGRLDEALAHFRRAIDLDPELPSAHNNLAAELAKMPGRSEEAIAHFRRAVEINPHHAQMRYNLAAELAKHPDRQAEAVTQYEAAIRCDPAFAAAHSNLANLLANVPGRLPEAIQHYEKAIRLSPGIAVLHNNLANALSQIPGRIHEAIDHYLKALELRPDAAVVHYNLAHKLAVIPDRRNEALRHFQVAVRLQPDFALGHFYLGQQLARIPGRQREALIAFQTARQLDPTLEEARTEAARLQRQFDPLNLNPRGLPTN